MLIVKMARGTFIRQSVDKRRRNLQADFGRLSARNKQGRNEHPCRLFSTGSPGEQRKKNQMPSDSRNDDLLGAIVLVVLLIGTATSNAYALLGMSVVATVFIAFFGRRRLGSGAPLVALVAAFTATAIAVVVALR